ncbi:MAG: polysaccharide biosynthesis protein [Alphaproteobacteria bacterium]|nr:polysaccharide biosynthesis protein [Alphaproteobacteria bacterium]
MNFLRQYLKNKSLPFFNKSVVAFIYDVTMAALSLLIALFLRVGQAIMAYNPWYIAQHVAVYSLVCAGVYFWTQLYCSVWRYVSIRELIAVTKAVSLAVFLYIPLAFFMSQSQSLPRSVPIIGWFITIALLGGGRFAYRISFDWLQKSKYSFSPHPRQNILLIGVNDQADLFIRETQRSSNSEYEIIGLIDDEKSRIGRRIHGISVLGTIENLQTIIENLTRKGLKPEILVMAAPTPDQIKPLMKLSEKMELFLAQLPQMSDLNQAKGETGMRLKPVALEDLLGRPQASLDRESMAQLILGKRVLVTGAGGSIGGELVQQICAFKPAQLTLLDHSEYLLYTIDQEVQEKHPHIPRSMRLADITDANRIENIIKTENPHLVFHAAALKHVPIAEHNPIENILSNIIGTKNLAEACRVHKVQAMVVISTDKAINPTNVMGATKRVAEKYCQALDIEELSRSRLTKTKETRYITVRFGNVLGSTGSVIPLFQRQLKQGGPLTVTDPKMTRYFMTIHEAVELVLQAAALGVSESTQAGSIFVLDMGEPVKIYDLARQMIRLAGLRPEIDIKISYTGARPGEKLYEELFYQSEELQPTRIQSIQIGKPSTENYLKLSKALKELESLARSHNSPGALKLLKQLAPEYIKLD